MKKILVLNLVLAAVLSTTGCQRISHNGALLGFGNVLEFGSVEYGRLLYVNGVFIMDISRENSSFEVEVDDEAGLTFDTNTKTLKGLKRIHRSIGHQATGYLSEIAGKDTKAAAKAIEYLGQGEVEKGEKSNERSH